MYLTFFALLLLSSGYWLAISLVRLAGTRVSNHFAERGATNSQTSIDDLVLKVERHLQSEPKDGRGWEILAPVYMQFGRYTDFGERLAKYIAHFWARLRND